jgi:hypothetical protein
MAVVNTKATAISNADATPKILNPPHLTANYVRQAVGLVTVVSGDSANSVYRVARLRSSDRVSSIAECHDAFSTSGAMSFGLYRTAADGGAVVAIAQFAAAVSIVAASVVKTGITFQNQAITNAEKRIWEILGLAADPQIDYDLCVTVTNVGATGAGNIAVWVEYISGN